MSQFMQIVRMIQGVCVKTLKFTWCSILVSQFELCVRFFMFCLCIYTSQGYTNNYYRKSDAVRRIMWPISSWHPRKTRSIESMAWSFQYILTKMLNHSQMLTISIKPDRPNRCWIVWESSRMTDFSGADCIKLLKPQTSLGICNINSRILSVETEEFISN